MKNILFFLALFVVWGSYAQPVQQAEYFFNTDPGYGNGTPVSFAPGEVVELNFDADASALSPGIHTLYVRVKSGRWSQLFSRLIAVSPDMGISQAEYFFNEDPGYGNGTSISFSPGKIVELNFDADASALSPGIHTLYVRVKAGNSWSQMHSRIIGVSPEQGITQAEYFWGEDPGYGNGVPVDVTPGKIVELDFEIDLNDQAWGLYIYHFRVFSGVWSSNHIHEYCFMPEVDFTTNITDFGEPTTFTNLSETADESISFFWDVTGDGETDYTGPDDFTHVYDASGTYLAKLLIELEGGCRDSIIKEVVVRALSEITIMPVASSITYGQALEESLIEGGEAQHNEEPVSGSFVFVNPETIPQTAGVFYAEVLFVPEDTESFSEAILSLEVNVEPKELTISGSFTAEDKTYDGTMEATMVDNQLELLGIIHDDDVTLTNIVLGFAQSDPGNDITVSVVDAALTGPDVSNYTLSLQDAPTATASIYAPVFSLELLSNPDDIGATLTGAGNYEAGTEVTVKATANEAEGWSFLNWTDANDDVVSELASFDYTMPEEDVTLFANFKEDVAYTVTVNINPEGAGSVTGEGEYFENDDVILEALPEEGYEFVEWTGDYAGVNPVLEFTMPANDVEVTAQFAPTDYELTVNVDPVGSGQVTVDPEQPTYNVGYIIELTAIADTEDWIFLNWTDEDDVVLSGDAIFDYVMPARDVTLTANFIQDDVYAVTVNINPEGSGSVTGEGEYIEGQQVTLEATPEEGYEFVEWTGDYAGVNPVLEFTMPANDVEVTAHFASTGYELTVNVEPVGSGQVTVDPEQPTYNVGDAIELTAIADTEDWIFLNWTDENDAVLSGDAIFDYVMPARDITLTANFIQDDVFVEEITSTDVSIFPNPTRNKFTIESDEMIKRIRLINYNGQVLKERNIDSFIHVINVSNMHTGIYIIEIYTDESTVTKRIQVTR